MGKTFSIIIAVVAVVGFSSSAYFFSQSEVSLESPIIIKTQGDNSIIQEIESCIEQNLTGDSSVALNSFNTNMLLTLKQYAENAESEEELNEIKEKLYAITDCKP